jgi:hypothetical protein
MHVNNARYMMAATAADSGHRTDHAVQWAEQCAAYARASGNRQELAHAELTRARLTGGPDVEADLAEAVDAFRSVGDLRCLARSYLLLAGRRAPAEQVPLYERALEVADAAHDPLNQERALEGLVRAHWASGARHDAAVALGRLVTLVGYGPATSRCPDEMVPQLADWTAAIAEGQAHGSSPPVPTGPPSTG